MSVISKRVPVVLRPYNWWAVKKTDGEIIAIVYYKADAKYLAEAYEGSYEEVEVRDQ